MFSNLYCPFVAILIPILVASILFAQEGRSIDIYFGTGGNNCDAPEGIYRASFSQEPANLGTAELWLELKGAGWTSFHPTNADILYSTGDMNGQPSVVAVSTNGDAGKILSAQPTGDGGACFLTTDQTGQMLISAQYGGGSIAIFPLGDDGTIGPRSQLIEHHGGSKVVRGQQNAPHPHYVAISPDNQFAFVPDLGLDQLVAYRIDLKNKKLLPQEPIDVIPGGGPRHMKFHPSGKYAFVLNELALSVTVFRYDEAKGSMERLHTTEALTAAEKSENDFNSASEIHIQNGTHIYTANRGHDSISVFRFDADTEKLERIQLAPTHGSWPRNFNFSPDGKFLLAAGQDTNSVSLFQVDHEKGNISGPLRHMEHKSIFVPGPICVTVPKTMNK